MSTWDKIVDLGPNRFRCGHCGQNVSSTLGYYDPSRHETIYICTNCSRPTYFGSNGQIPGSLFGESVKELPVLIGKLYDEARLAYSVNAFTASVLICRKLLMHIAVQKGAKEGQNFRQYVEYLDEKHFVPPDGKAWVDHIRGKGNEANHEIVIMAKESAEDLITFIEMLLKFIYEFPARVKPKPVKPSA